MFRSIVSKTGLGAARAICFSFTCLRMWMSRYAVLNGTATEINAILVYADKKCYKPAG